METINQEATTFDLDAPEQGQDVAVREEEHPVATTQTEDAPAIADPILAQVMAFAQLPNVDKDMFDRLMAWQEREKETQAEERFNETMNRCQAEIEPVARTAENTQTKSFYAKLEAVDGAIRPIYLRHGFSVAYNTVPPLVPGNIRVECEVSLGRHSKKYYREAPADTLGPKGTAVKTILHGGGSTETYLKRYAVTGAFNVVFKSLTDDDGVKGGMRYIDNDQMATIEALMTETKTNPQEFFRLMITEEIYELNEIQEKDFARLVNALQRKHHQMVNRKKTGPTEGDAA